MEGSSSKRSSGGASGIINRILSVFSSMAKGKSSILKSKKETVKNRFVMFSLLKNKKLPPVLGEISQKIHALILGEDSTTQQQCVEEIDTSSAIVLYNADANVAVEVDEDNINDYKYPDPRHYLLEEEEEDDDDDDNDLDYTNASVIDIARNCKEEEGQNFSLEDEIDNVADLFIKKVHKRMRMQKLESFKRYQDMLHRSVA